MSSPEKNSSQYVYPYSKEFLHRLKTIKDNRKTLATSMKQDVFQSRANLGGTMSFPSASLPSKGSGMVISAPLANSARTNALARQRSRSVDSSRSAQSRRRRGVSRQTRDDISDVSSKGSQCFYDYDRGRDGQEWNERRRGSQSQERSGVNDFYSRQQRNSGQTREFQSDLRGNSIGRRESREAYRDSASIGSYQRRQRSDSRDSVQKHDNYSVTSFSSSSSRVSRSRRSKSPPATRSNHNLYRSADSASRESQLSSSRKPRLGFGSSTLTNREPIRSSSRGRSIEDDRNQVMQGTTSSRIKMRSKSCERSRIEKKPWRYGKSIDQTNDKKLSGNRARENANLYGREQSVISKKLDTNRWSSRRDDNKVRRDDFSASEHGDYISTIEPDRVQENVSSGPSNMMKSDYFIDLSTIVPSSSKEYQTPVKPPFEASSDDEEERLMNEIEQLDRSPLLRSREHKHTPYNHPGDRATSRDPVISSDIVVLSCRYSLDFEAWSLRMIVLRASSTLAEVVRAIARQFEALPVPDFDIVVKTPQMPSQVFSSVQSLLSDPLSDELVPVPHLRENSTIEIFPSGSDRFNSIGNDKDVQLSHSCGGEENHEDHVSNVPLSQDWREVETDLDDANNAKLSSNHQENKERDDPNGNYDTTSDLSADQDEQQLSFYDLYELGEELGRGSFSVVHKAVHRESGHVVAVKCIPVDGMTPEEQQQLYHEVDILRSVQHPNVIKFYGFFMEDEVDPQENRSIHHHHHNDNDHSTDDFLQQKMYYLVTEYLSGGELFHRIVQKTTYSEQDARDVMHTLLATIGVLHAKSIVHRDLKPENLLLEDRTSDRSIKIADFGLAEVTDGYVSLKTPCGTPGYAAPEIIQSKKYGKACDMWSLGVIMYILLGGYPPFDADCYETSMLMPVEFHAEQWGHISSEAKDLLRKLLTVEPLKRYSAEEALLHAWLATPLERFACPNLLETLEQLRRFHKQRKFRAAAKAVMATRRISSKQVSPSDDPSYSQAKEQRRLFSSSPQVTKRYSDVYSDKRSSQKDSTANEVIGSDYASLFSTLGHDSSTKKRLTAEDLLDDEIESFLSGRRELRSPSETDTPDDASKSKFKSKLYDEAVMRARTNNSGPQQPKPDVKYTRPF